MFTRFFWCAHQTLCFSRRRSLPTSGRVPAHPSLGPPPNPLLFKEEVASYLRAGACSPVSRATTKPFVFQGGGRFLPPGGCVSSPASLGPPPPPPNAFKEEVESYLRGSRPPNLLGLATVKRGAAWKGNRPSRRPPLGRLFAWRARDRRNCPGGHAFSLTTVCFAEGQLLRAGVLLTRIHICMYVCMHVHTKHFVHFLEEEVQPSYLRAGALSRSARSVAPPTLLFRGPGVTHSPDPSSVCHSGFSFFGGISSSERFPQTERSIQSFHHGTGGAEPAAGRDRQAYTGQGKVWPRTENRDACGLPTHGSRSARPEARTARPLIGRVRNRPVTGGRKSRKHVLVTGRGRWRPCDMRGGCAPGPQRLNPPPSQTPPHRTFTSDRPSESCPRKERAAPGAAPTPEGRGRTRLSVRRARRGRFALPIAGRRPAPGASRHAPIGQVKQKRRAPAVPSPGRRGALLPARFLF